MKKTLTALTLLFSFALTGCFQSKHSLVKVCAPSDRLLRQAPTKYANHTPLNTADLRHMLLDDTTHYKILIVYSYCCSGCREAMSDTYLPLMHSLDTARCRMYFVLNDCGSLPWNDDYLNYYGIATRYYMRDSDTLFRYKRGDKYTNSQNWTNIANYIFQPRSAFEDCDYAPLTLIVSPDGHIKQEYWQFNNGGFLTAYDLRDMMHRDARSIYELDFNHIDTTRHNYDWNFDDMPTPDTVTFRNYKPQPKYCTPDGKCF
ncbi:MAG: hypothetical protein IJM88_04960 [Bacteroidales bacterium]|nr:hypothetical protein [Bacteroidales bacterium]